MTEMAAAHPIAPHEECCPKAAGLLKVAVPAPKPVRQGHECECCNDCPDQEVSPSGGALHVCNLASLHTHTCKMDGAYMQ